MNDVVILAYFRHVPFTTTACNVCACQEEEVLELQKQLAFANANSERMQNYLDNLLLRRNFRCTAKVYDHSRLIVTRNVKGIEVRDQM